MPIKYNLIDVWDDLPHEWKILILVHHRATRTMEAYESLALQGKV